MTVALASFRFTDGTPRQYASSPPVVRQFCARCGSQITYRHENAADTIDVTVATLDRPGMITPADHLWMSDAVAWDEITDGRPAYPAERT